MDGNYDAALFKVNQLVFSGVMTSGDEWDYKREKWEELIEKAIENDEKENP